MLKPKSNEKPKKQIGYLKRAREMQELAHANFEPERGDKSLSRIHKNIIKPRFGNTYRTFLRAMNTDTSVIERLERERDERELCKLRDKNKLNQTNERCKKFTKCTLRAVNSTCFRMFPGCGIPSRAYGVFMTGLTPGGFTSSTWPAT